MMSAVAEGRPTVEPWEVGDNPQISPDTRMIPTAPDRTDERAVVLGRWGRWAFATALTAFLALGLAGVFGVRSATATGEGGGYELRVTYAAVTRSGLASPFAIEVTRRDGAPFREPVQLAVSSDYLALFDANQLAPAPTSEASTRDRVVWEFEPPPGGDTLRIRLDARVEPAVQWGRDGFVELVDDGETLVAVSFHTRVMP
jgi:hypothetical protein